MAHFAKINENNIVLQVLAVNDSDILNENGVPSETVGQQYLENNNNWPANMWIQTDKHTKNNISENGGTAFRGNYAGIGYSWDSVNQIFWPPKPEYYPSWVKDNSTADWQSPIGLAPALTAEQQNQNNANTHVWYYDWDEENQSWVLKNSLT